MNVLKMIGSTSFLMANKEIIRLTDIETAILYSDLAGAQDYWSERNETTDGYFFRTQNEIELNTTLSSKVQLRCLRLLEEKGLIKTKVKGLPAKKYFCIDSECMYRLSQVLQKGETSIAEMDNQVKQKSTIKTGENVETSIAFLDNQVCTKGLSINNRINNNKGIIIDNNNKEQSDFYFSESTQDLTSLNDKKTTLEILPVVVYQKPKKQKEKSPQIYPANFSPAIIRAIENFIEYRKEIKKPFKSDKSQQTKVNQWSDQIEAYGEMIVLDSIETAIANGWQGTFIDMKKVELQKQSNNSNNQFKTKEDATFAHYYSQLRNVDYGFND